MKKELTNCKEYKNIQQFLSSANKKKEECNNTLSAYNLDGYSSLPTINVKFGTKIYPMVLDTGSSVSLLSRNVYEEIKQVTKSKILSRQVQIKTVNSVLQFSACSEISFKIGKHHFKNHFI